jgi:hypothetical protein
LLTHKEAAQEFLPGSVQQHVYVRKNIVNQLGLLFEQEPILYGVMTGEPTAEHFLHRGATHIFPGQLVFFYTDGFLPYVYDPDFIQTVRTDDERFSQTQQYIEQKESLGEDKYLKEKSIIILQF